MRPAGEECEYIYGEVRGEEREGDGGKGRGSRDEVRKGVGGG